MNVQIYGRNAPMLPTIYGHSTLDEGDTSTRQSRVTFSWHDFDNSTGSEVKEIEKGYEGSVILTHPFTYDYRNIVSASTVITINYAATYFTVETGEVQGTASDAFDIVNTSDTVGDVRIQELVPKVQIFPGQIIINDKTTAWEAYYKGSQSGQAFTPPPVWKWGADGLPVMYDMSNNFATELSYVWDDWARDEWDYPLNYSVWKVDANNDGYPWIWGFEKIPKVDADSVYIKQSDLSLKTYYVHIKSETKIVPAKLYIKTETKLVSATK